MNLEGVFTVRHDRRKVTDWVYEQLRDAIIELRLRPGEPLREAAIAKRLGVSKTPIREALTRLKQEGLVETTSFKGAVVTGYSRKDLFEIYELRELLEGACARQAALSADAEVVGELESLLKESEKLRDGAKTAELAHSIARFDTILYRQMKNDRIRALIENLQAHLTRIGKLTEEIPGRIEASVDEHGKVIKAIRDANPDEAERLMRKHIRSVREDQLRSIAPSG